MRPIGIFSRFYRIRSYASVILRNNIFILNINNMFSYDNSRLRPQSHSDSVRKDRILDNVDGRVWDVEICDVDFGFICVK